jgi:hypothetical protein
MAGMNAGKKTLNALTLEHVHNISCFIPVGLLMEYAKIRPVQKAGVSNLKMMIGENGYDLTSVIKVRAPASGPDIQWDMSFKKKQAQGGAGIEQKDWEKLLDGRDLKMPDERTEEDVAFLYGVIDGAHRLWALFELVMDPDFPGYTLQFLVPCQVMKHSIPEELALAIASRKFVLTAAHTRDS